MIERVVFWQNFPTHHQSAQIRALAAHDGLEVMLATESGIPAWRRELGWSEPDFGQAEVVVRPTESAMTRLLYRRPRRSMHIFSGIGAYKMVHRAFKRCIPTAAHMGVLSEPEVWLGVKGAVRLARSRIDARRFAQRLDMILAIGHMAQRWFEISGYPLDKIYPYGYFVETPEDMVDAGHDALPKAVRDLGDETFRMVFVGQCIRRKGVDLLLDALARLRDSNWHLSLIGDGEKRKEFEGLCRSKGLVERVDFLGALPNADTMKVLELSDLLVLPSRWDGWGAVVNEALLRGVPVVCSRVCGAADLLGDRQRGETFATDDAEDLLRVLDRQLKRGRVDSQRREHIRRWAYRSIGGEAAAAYTGQVIAYAASGRSGARPMPPWFRAGGS